MKLINKLNYIYKKYFANTYTIKKKSATKFKYLKGQPQLFY